MLYDIAKVLCWWSVGKAGCVPSYPRPVRHGRAWLTGLLVAHSSRTLLQPVSLGATKYVLAYCVRSADKLVFHQPSTLMVTLLCCTAKATLYAHTYERSV